MYLQHAPIGLHLHQGSIDDLLINHPEFIFSEQDQHVPAYDFKQAE
jgi:hypothetical protein